jgi:hypothetical protein
MALWNRTSFVTDVLDAVDEDFAAKRRIRFRNSTEVLCCMLSDQNLKTSKGLDPETLNEAKACLRLHYDRLKITSKNSHDLEHHIIDYLDAVQIYLKDLL